VPVPGHHGGEDRRPVRRGRGKEGPGFIKLGFHSLRHTYLSRLATAGIAPDVRQLLSEHVDEKIAAIAMRGISELRSEGLFQFHVFIEIEGWP
jgi:integrase